MSIDVEAALQIEESAVLRNLNIVDLRPVPSTYVSGSITGVAIDDDDDVIEIASTPEGYFLLGMEASGNGDAEFQLLVGGSVVSYGRIMRGAPNVDRKIGRLEVAEGSTIKIRVVNRSRSSAARFNATIIGEIV